MLCFFMLWSMKRYISVCASLSFSSSTSSSFLVSPQVFPLCVGCLGPKPLVYLWLPKAAASQFHPTFCVSPVTSFHILLYLSWSQSPVGYFPPPSPFLAPHFFFIFFFLPFLYYYLCKFVFVHTILLCYPPFPLVTFPSI